VEKKTMKSIDPKGNRALLFDRSSKQCLPIGSVLEVEAWDTFPKKDTFLSFAGHMIAVRRRGIDTAFRLRTVIARVGVEQVFRLYAPNIKTIRVIHRGAARGKRYKKAKLYFTREPGTRNTLGSVDHIVKKAKAVEASVKAERERLLAKKGKVAPKSAQPEAKPATQNASQKKKK
jgi:large subunit ribosomal protein L19